MRYLLILLLSTTVTFAQQNLVNGNFEDTLTIKDQSDSTARSWTRTDFGSATTADAHTGTSAVYIWNWYYYAHGELTNGVPSFSGGGGTPINFSPVELTGFYKYLQGDVQSQNDSAVAIVCLTHYNTATSRRDTVGYGIKKFGFISDYTPFDVDIQYSSATAPDTATVKFISSTNGFCSNTSAGNCLFLYIDEVTLKDTETGFGREVEFKDALKIFPNPATEKIQVLLNAAINEQATIHIYNTLGEIVLEKEITASSSLIDVSTLPRGAYLVKVNEVVGRLVKE